MKVTKNICIEFEIMQKLKEEDNASDLINSLLYNHYKMKAMDNMTREEKKAYLIKKIEIEKAKKKIKEMEKNLNESA